MSSLGDIILTEPITALLKKEFPDADIDYLTKPVFKELVSLFPHVDNIHTDYKNRGFLKSLGQYDYAFDLHGKLSSAIALHAIRATKKFTYKKQRLLRQKIVAGRTDASISSTSSLYFSAIEPVIGKQDIPNPSITIPHIEDILNKTDRLQVGIFPGASYNSKRWPSEYFKLLIEDLISKSKAEVTLLGSKSEYELCESIASIHPTYCTNRAGEFDLVRLAKFVSEFDLLITNDSGPMHLASAYAKPLVAIFGATHPRLGFAPMNDNAVVLTMDYPCQPCSLHGGDVCPLKHFRCMQDILPDEVYNACLKVLE